MIDLDELIVRMDEDFRKNGNYASLVHKRLLQKAQGNEWFIDEFFYEFLLQMSEMYTR